MKSVEPLMCQASEVRDALLEVRDKTNDALTKTEVQSLSEGSYRFSICSVVWYDILIKIQAVSKLMQSPIMQVALSLLRKTRKELQYYRVSSFVGAQILAKKMCESLNVQADLKEKG